MKQRIVLAYKNSLPYREPWMALGAWLFSTIVACFLTLITDDGINVPRLVLVNTLICGMLLFGVYLAKGWTSAKRNDGARNA
jgi:hypothetical protein